MTHIITIETNNVTYFEQFKKLAQQLGVTTTEIHEETLSEASKATIGQTNVEKYLEHKRKNPPVKIAKDFDFNAVVDAGINL